MCFINNIKYFKLRIGVICVCFSKLQYERPEESLLDAVEGAVVRLHGDGLYYEASAVRHIAGRRWLSIEKHN